MIHNIKIQGFKIVIKKKRMLPYDVEQVVNEIEYLNLYINYMNMLKICTLYRIISNYKLRFVYIYRKISYNDLVFPVYST